MLAVQVVDSSAFQVWAGVTVSKREEMGMENDEPTGETGSGGEAEDDAATTKGEGGAGERPAGGEPAAPEPASEN